MKRTIFYAIAIVLCGIGLLTVTQLYNQETDKTVPIIEQRDTSGVDPFAQATRVELITYNNRMDWWIGEIGMDKPLLEIGMLNMSTDSIH